MRNFVHQKIESYLPVKRGYIDKIVANLPIDERIAEGVRRLRR